MHWSRELLALTAGVRWRIAGLVVVGLLIVAASLASLVFAGRAIAAACPTPARARSATHDRRATLAAAAARAPRGGPWADLRVDRRARRA